MPELIPAEPLTPGWHAARRQGITATDIVTILGLSSTDSQYSLYWRKLGQVPEVEDNDRFRLGRYLEDYVFDRWLEQAREFRVQFQESALYRHSARPWQMATVDALTYAREPVELKSWADADRHSWGQGCVYDHDGTLLVHDDQVPARVRAQVLWQMDVMDVAAGHVGVVFLPSGEFRSYTIEHNGNCFSTDVLELDDSKPLCPICDDQELMRLHGQEFMRRLRLELPPPDPDASLATLAAVRARFTRQPDKTAEIDATTWDTWLNWKRAEEMAAELKRDAEVKLRHEAGEASVYTVEGQPVARRVITTAQVKAHTRHQDYLKRIKQGDDSEG